MRSVIILVWNIRTEIGEEKCYKNLSAGIKPSFWEQRRNAKTVNFGIVYGISAFGLSERLNIARKEAKEIIEKKNPKGDFDGDVVIGPRVVLEELKLRAPSDNLRKPDLIVQESKPRDMVRS